MAACTSSRGSALTVSEKSCSRRWRYSLSSVSGNTSRRTQSQSAALAPSQGCTPSEASAAREQAAFSQACSNGHV